MSHAERVPVPPDTGARGRVTPLAGAAEERARRWLGPTLLAALVLAWANRFVQDDAFISFRYAENLARGQGLVWNPGERVEGYTNFLWTLAIAVGAALNVDLVRWSMALGLLCFAVSLLSAAALALRVTGSAAIALLTVVLLGTNYTFSAFATGGLETQLQCALLTLAAVTALPPSAHARTGTPQLAAFSSISGAALLTRLDSALVVGPLALAVLVRTLRETGAARERLGRLAALALPCLLLVAPWLAWKQAYYGELLPNTWYAKAASATSLGRGVQYLRGFLSSYALWVFVPGVLLALLGRARLERRMLAGLLAIVAVWCAWLVRIGGDFIEFRMLVPILPLAFTIAAWTTVHVVPGWPLRLAVLLVAVAGSLSHATTYAAHELGRIEPVAQLAGHLERPGEDWSGIGRMLARTFGEGRSSVSIATTAAGAIPYYSRLATVDMLGLNDRWVARHGTPIGDVPGHQRLAPLRYLVERRVNLVLSHPVVLPPGAPVTRLPYLGEPPGPALLASRVIELPIGHGYRVLALYLTPHPEVDAAIARERWTTFAITPELAATTR